MRIEKRVRYQYGGAAENLLEKRYSVTALAKANKG